MKALAAVSAVRLFERMVSGDPEQQHGCKLKNIVDVTIAIMAARPLYRALKEIGTNNSMRLARRRHDDLVLIGGG